jgi:alkaline phosphatase D
MRYIVLILSTCFSLQPSVLHAQHDGARDSVRLIANGKFARVTQTLNKKNPFAGESESLFVEMLSLLAQEKPQDALLVARKAVDKGLPFERLLAGPREQLSKLHKLPEYQAWKTKTAPSLLVHGPMVGNVTDSGASFWVRTSQGAKVSVSLNEGAVESTTRSTSSSTDFTAVATAGNLKSNTLYSYSVKIDGKPTSTGEFRTFPAQGKGGKFSVGFGGGAGFVPEWEYMWDTILKFKPNAFLMLGDNVYIDQPEKSLTQHYCYYRRQSRPEWKRFTSQTPMFSIWDDHDFGTNDCVPGPAIEKPVWKQQVWNRFRENWVNPSYAGGEDQPGCWYDFHIGDVHFIMLDGRYYRDLKGGTMLGPIQKKWLFETLAKSSATFKVIASPVPFTAKIKKGSRDPWDGFPEEREEIFSHIESKRIEGVFLIAADRHRTDLRTTKRPNGYTLYEFESSRLTNHHTHPVVKTDGLIWGYNKTCSFGLMKFNTRAKDPTVEFVCVDIDGKIHETFLLQRSKLKLPN